MKKVIGILSIVLFVITMLQSCAAGLGDALQNKGGSSGGSGVLLSFCMLIAGIIILASKKSKGMVITSIVFYLLGALFGYAAVGMFKDLAVWATLNVIFAGLLINPEPNPRFETIG